MDSTIDYRLLIIDYRLQTNTLPAGRGCAENWNYRVGQL